MKKMWALLISACILAGGVAGCGSQAEPQGTVTQKVAEALRNRISKQSPL